MTLGDLLIDTAARWSMNQTLRLLRAVVGVYGPPRRRRHADWGRRLVRAVEIVEHHLVDGEPAPRSGVIDRGRPSPGEVARTARIRTRLRCPRSG